MRDLSDADWNTQPLAFGELQKKINTETTNGVKKTQGFYKVFLPWYQKYQHLNHH